MLLSRYFIIIERMKKFYNNNKRFERRINKTMEVKEIKPQILSLLSANPRFYNIFCKLPLLGSVIHLIF